MRMDLTPKLEISSNACARVAGFARSTGASKVMDCEWEACAAAGRAAAMSAQSARMDGAIRLMGGGAEGCRYNRWAAAKVAVAGDEGAPRPLTQATPLPGEMAVAPAPDDIVRPHAEAAANDRPPLLVVEPLLAFLDAHGLGSGGVE